MENFLKKLTKALKTSARVMFALRAIMLTGEFLIISLIESAHAINLKDVALKKWLFKVIEPIATTHRDRFPRPISADIQADEC